MAKYVRDCIRALGVRKTPKEVGMRLDAYVQSNEEYYDYVTHDVTAFIFYCNPTVGSDIAITDESTRFTDVVVEAIVKCDTRSVILI